MARDMTSWIDWDRPLEFFSAGRGEWCPVYHVHRFKGEGTGIPMTLIMWKSKDSTVYESTIVKDEFVSSNHVRAVPLVEHYWIGIVQDTDTLFTTVMRQTCHSDAEVRKMYRNEYAAAYTLLDVMHVGSTENGKWRGIYK